MFDVSRLCRNTTLPTLQGARKASKEAILISELPRTYGNTSKTLVVEPRVFEGLSAGQRSVQGCADAFVAGRRTSTH